MKIHDLTLFTDRTEALFSFYEMIFGDRLLRTPKGFKIRLPNRSHIQFEGSDQPWYYHFAFNIQEDQIEKAHAFVKRLTTPLPDPDTGDTLIDFPAWNAHSVYFRDPANNVVEFIARHDLNHSRKSSFNRDSILSISEIGTPSRDVKENFDILHACNLKRYSGDFKRFCAAGDEEGLFILKKTGGHWFPSFLDTIEAPYLADFETASGRHRIAYREGRLNLIVP